MREETPAKVSGYPAGVPAPHWHERKEFWVKLEADDAVNTDIVHFATGSDPSALAPVLKCHPPLYSEERTGENAITFGHLGRPCSTWLAWDRRGPGLFHTAKDQRTVHFRCFAGTASALDKLQVFADELVACGLDKVATAEMEDLEVAGRKEPTQDSYEGGPSQVYMRNLPRLFKAVFPWLGDAEATLSASEDEKRCYNQLREGGLRIMTAHGLMLALDWDGDKTTQLRAACRAVNDWLVAFDRTTVHPLLEKTGIDLYNAACHHMRHVCDMADKLWAEARIPIGRFSEQGNEHKNKDVKFELQDHSQNWLSPTLSTNKLASALTHISREMFQIKEVALRQKRPCKLCVRCDGGAERCTRWPACKDAPMKLPHWKEGKRCHHSEKYDPKPSANTIIKALEADV